jgi:hypothetical protein
VVNSFICIIESTFNQSHGLGIKIIVQLTKTHCYTTPDVVPEPSTYALFGLGAIRLLIVMWRKKVA